MIKLELTIDEVNMVLKALVKQPFEEVAGLVDKVTSQGKSQLDEAAASKAEEKPE